jgi:VWFA-related protein
MKKQYGRKALIVLSDGVDNGSKVTLEKAIESAQRADTLVYTILFADEQGYGGGPRMGGRRGGGRGRYPGQRPDGKKVLQRLSKETGGGLYEVSKNLSIERVFLRIEKELRSQYSLGYTSDQTQAGMGYRKIHLAARRKGLVVQTREGYYAKTQ